jgi:hypothetical protein
MSEEKIQAWLDGDLKEKPADPALGAYEQLYAALASDPGIRLAPGFAARVTARLRAEQDRQSARYVNLAGAAAVFGSFAVMYLYLGSYDSLNLVQVFETLRNLFLPAIVLNKTWILTAIVCGALAVIDRWVSANRV